MTKPGPKASEQRGPDPGKRRGRSFSPWQQQATEAAGASNVLVVDSDGVSRRFVELALNSKYANGFQSAVEGVKDAAGAFEALRSTLFDLVISETDLPDMSGIRFCRLLQQESRLSGIPFLFLATDTRIQTKVVALRAGIDDYLTKPCDASELCARVFGHITRQRRVHDARRERSYTLGGDFSTLPLPDLVSILELSRRSGVLSVITLRSVGELCLDAGQVVHASFGNLQGADAFYRMMAEGIGKFEFSPGVLPPETPQTIHESITSLLMETARRLDHQELSSSLRIAQSTRPTKSPQSTRFGAGPPSRPASVRITEKPLEPLLAAPTIAAQFETGISDECALGELRLWNRAELAQWTRAELGRERFHVQLIADLNQGISALLALASQATERLIFDALAADEKSLGLAFFLRYERVLDVTLIDIQSPATFLDALNRRPALTILAPPEGNLLGIGPKALVELESLFRRVPASALLWVARTDMDQNLSASLSVPVSLSVRGALGEPELDLRSLLAKGVRFWSTKTSGPIPPPVQRRPA